ncbi:MAG: hypothetical protein ACFE0J_20470 [Elainellaceae cyanobacterium]
MIEIDRQIQALIDDAPQDGTTPNLVKAIAPALKLTAEQLKHPQYYVLQTLDHGWVLTTLQQRNQPSVEKNIIYAFPTLEDVAARRHPSDDPQIVALPVPVTHILFQMLAMKTVYSVVFFDMPGNTQSGTEIARSNLQHIIRLSLKKTRTTPQPPPDIA